MIIKLMLLCQLKLKRMTDINVIRTLLYTTLHLKQICKDAKDPKSGPHGAHGCETGNVCMNTGHEGAWTHELLQSLEAVLLFKAFSGILGP